MQGRFDRQYRLRIKTKNSNEIVEIGEATNGYPLRIYFNVEKVESQPLNMANIEIWNLSEAHVKMLTQAQTTLYLDAGYAESCPQIFVGTIVQSQTERDGANRKTTLQCVDNCKAIEDKIISVSFEKTTAFNLIEYIKSKTYAVMTITHNAGLRLGRYKIDNYSYIGSVKGMIDEVCAMAGVRHRITNGVFNIYGLNESISDKMYVIDSTTGMIGFPKRIYESSVGIDENNDSTNSYSLIGWEVDFLMNGSISVGDKVKLVSKEMSLDGTYYVYQMQISGDNYSSNWKCTAKVREIGTLKKEAEIIN